MTAKSLGGMDRKTYKELTGQHLNTGDVPAVFSAAERRLRQRPSYSKLTAVEVPAASTTPPPPEAETERPQPTRNDNPIARTPTGFAVNHRTFSSPDPNAKPIVLRRPTRASTIDSTQTSAEPVAKPIVKSVATTKPVAAPETPSSSSPPAVVVTEPKPKKTVTVAPTPAPVSSTKSTKLKSKPVSEAETIVVYLYDGKRIITTELAKELGIDRTRSRLPSYTTVEFDSLVRSGCSTTSNERS